MPATSSAPLDAALSYALDCRWSPIPIDPDSKKPTIPWTNLQQEIASERQIRNWYRDHPGAGVGIVTGPVSNLLVGDADTAAGRERIEVVAPGVTVMAATPRGRHSARPDGRGMVRRPTRRSARGVARRRRPGRLPRRG